MARKIERAVTDLQQQRREVKARQAVEDQKRDAQQRRGQEEARRAAEAETRRESGRAKAIEDFAVFRDIDAPWCPEMVALPMGEFLMGSPKDEEGRFRPASWLNAVEGFFARSNRRYSYEDPQHRVRIGYRLGLGRYPVTAAEYRKFVEVSGHRQTDRYPVVDVSWRDAVAYSEWLGRQTGKSYRLPSEAEWEYACRAGTTTRYAFGDAITPKDANYSESKLGKTTEVGAFHRTPGVSMTCTATSGSGCRTFGMIATRTLRPMASRG